MTPFYDVLSAWPLIGRGRNQLPLQDAKLAMAVVGKRRHYRLAEIQPRHWRELAERVGGAALWERLQALADAAPRAFDRIDLPRTFPERVIVRMSEGVRKQSQTFFKAIRSQAAESTPRAVAT
jgi:serine/threonine-protein kinase HipA